MAKYGILNDGGKYTRLKYPVYECTERCDGSSTDQGGGALSQGESQGRESAGSKNNGGDCDGGGADRAPWLDDAIPSVWR